MTRPPLLFPNDIGSLVMVTWRDAYFDFDEPDTPREDYQVRTVGFVVGFDDTWIHLAAEELPEDDGYRATTHIPRDLILPPIELLRPCHE